LYRSSEIFCLFKALLHHSSPSTKQAFEEPPHHMHQIVLRLRLRL
jgi:hypothetical protein